MVFVLSILLVFILFTFLFVTTTDLNQRFKNRRPESRHGAPIWGIFPQVHMSPASTAVWVWWKHGMRRSGAWFVCVCFQVSGWQKLEYPQSEFNGSCHYTGWYRRSGNLQPKSVVATYIDRHKFSGSCLIIDWCVHLLQLVLIPSKNFYK